MAKKDTYLLTKAEEFYIENNPKKPAEELAADLGKPLSAVREHIHKTSSTSRISRLMIREKGCVIMTEGASAASDDSRKGRVSEQAIQAAVARQDFAEAARLQAIFREQNKKVEDDAAEKSKGYIHYINRDHKK
jgi:hypothetical protein